MFWIFLNWALGFQTLGCRVIWLEEVSKKVPVERLEQLVAILRLNLEHYGLTQALALYSRDGAIPAALVRECLTLEDAVHADLLFNILYSTPPEVVRLFRRSALLDIDPGLLQTWVHLGQIRIDHHDRYFTIGETVGRPGAAFPSLGLEWHYTPPAVSLEAWPVAPLFPDAAFTTVMHWHAGAWIEGDSRPNDKREGFLPYIDLPRLFPGRFELGLYPDIEKDRDLLLSRGWGIANTLEVAATPWDYQNYIRRSRGEFSCAKPTYVEMQTAWISDRTICYLASGKPTVVQDTGPSRFLSADEGLLRFSNVAEAIRCLERVAADYERHSAAARRLAEDYFDARKNAERVLERAFD